MSRKAIYIVVKKGRNLDCLRKQGRLCDSFYLPRWLLFLVGFKVVE